MANSILGNPVALTANQAVSDGFWAMLQPLAPGEYTLRFGGDLNFANLDIEDSLGLEEFEGFLQVAGVVSQDITYQVTSVPEPTSALALLSVAGTVIFAAGRRQTKS
ncbi:MAG: PEP-CTERM sorting domain-containing protein [Oscillatoriales cyanobacterium RM2_1_1]|nr:PEP-CTERM sorting domain-containing protein [Oscillatoriales cyanobacterium RM2_1_1]